MNEHHQEEDIAGKNLLLVPYLPPYYRFYEVERHLLEKKTSLPDLDGAHTYNRRRQSGPVGREGKGGGFSTSDRAVQHHVRDLELISAMFEENQQ